jgi:hypothetical protein
MTATVVVCDEASAKRVCGPTVRVTRDALGLIRLTVPQRQEQGVGSTTSPYMGYVEMPAHLWRGAIQELQRQLVGAADRGPYDPPEDRGPGLFDQSGEPWDAGEGG